MNADSHDTPPWASPGEQPAAPIGEASLSLLGRSFRLTCAAEAKPQIEALNRQLALRLDTLRSLAGSDPFTVLALAALELQDEANEARASAQAAQAAREALIRAEQRIDALSARIDQWLGDDFGS